MNPWQEIARDARKAASGLVAMGHYRSSISRAYYAAFSRVTMEFHLHGIAMAFGREAPSHQRIRALIERNLTTLHFRKRVALSIIRGRLYAMRLLADYSSSAKVDAREGREAISLMNKVFEFF